MKGNKMNHKKAYLKGIFIQKTDLNSNWCVTFPMVSLNLALYPSNDFKTFFQALNFAKHVISVISDLKGLPIYENNIIWKKSYNGKPCISGSRYYNFIMKG